MSFSELRWSASSARMAPATAGSTAPMTSSALRYAAVAAPVSSTSALLFDVADLLDAPLVASALEGRRQPQAQDLVGEPAGDDPSAHGEHVGVVVLAAQPGRV